MQEVECERKFVGELDFFPARKRLALRGSLDNPLFQCPTLGILHKQDRRESLEGGAEEHDEVRVAEGGQQRDLVAQVDQSLPVGDHVGARLGHDTQAAPPSLVELASGPTREWFGLLIDLSARNGPFLLGAALLQLAHLLLGHVGEHVVVCAGGLSAVLAQKVAHIDKVPAHGVVERRVAPPVARVDARLPLDKVLDSIELSLAGREVQRSAGIVIRLVHVLELELFERSDITGRGRVEEAAKAGRRVHDAGLFVVHVDGGLGIGDMLARPMRDVELLEESSAVLVVLQQCVVQRGAAPAVPGRQISALVVQQLQELDVAFARGDVGRSAPVVVARVHAHAFGE
mmetsp:Transcript_25393/g.80759  ORF Transcript_25393/g.80759 Transcript_25393/m.80759 type:complete len:344 (-) Transcript_25393:98-1129(-)